MKVSIICAISLDGYINPKVEMKPQWSSREDRRWFMKETRRTGVMIMGQNTFTYAYDNKPMPKRWSIVVTRDTNQESTEDVWFTDDKPAAILKEVEKRGYNEVLVMGGSQINSLFMNAGLVTDLYITVTSHLFGSGVPLFAGLNEQIKLELVSSEPLGEGEMLNHYKVT
jgi:dihydrofolate reductase